MTTQNMHEGQVSVTQGAGSPSHIQGVGKSDLPTVHFLLLIVARVVANIYHVLKLSIRAVLFPSCSLQCSICKTSMGAYVWPHSWNA